MYCVYRACFVPRVTPRIIQRDTMSHFNDIHIRMSHHISTTAFQKLLLTIGSAATAIANPARGDMVATMAESSGFQALKYLQKVMMADPEGQAILSDQPRINSRSVNLNSLSNLSPGTLGREYFDWLQRNKASPDERLPVQFVDDPDLLYIMTRYRETHDLYHTVLGMPTNMLGEVTVKYVEAFHTKLPMCISGAMFGQLRLGPKHREIFLKAHLPWAVLTGMNAKNLMCVYYENYWDMPIAELRQKCNIPPAPKTPERRFI